MNNIWNELSEESKKHIKDVFSEFEPVCQEDLIKMNLMSDLFGKENLSPKSQIKTWYDVEKQGYYAEDEWVYEDKASERVDAIVYKGPFRSQIINKAIATFKIAKLIELGYGGMVTNEEWNNNTYKWHIVYDAQQNKYKVFWETLYKDPLSFHTEEQAIEFLENNRDLLDDYNMI